MIAFEQACDSRRLAIAADLFGLLEQEIYRENTYTGEERRNPFDILAVAEARLKALRATAVPPCSTVCSALVISSVLSAGRGLQSEMAVNASGA